MNRNTSEVLTETGVAPTTVKNTFKSNNCANTVFGLARAATKRRYSSSNGSPRVGAPPSDRTRHGSNPIAGPPFDRPPSVCPQADTRRVRSPAYQAFLRGRARPATAVIVAFVREHQDRREPGGLRWGVQPICDVLTEHGLPIAPSTYYDQLHAVASARAGPRRAAENRDQTGSSGELRCLRGPQGVAPVEPGGHGCGSLHRGPADAGVGSARGDPRRGQAHHDQRPGRGAGR